MHFSLKQRWLRIRKEIAAASLTSCLLAITLLFPLFLFALEDSTSPTQAEIAAQLVKLPLSFERNEGQTDASVKYLTRGNGSTFYFTPQEIVMVLQQASPSKSLPASQALKIQFMGAKQNPLLMGREKQECKSNYLIGNDPQKWHCNIANYSQICYQDVYPGIDVVFYGNPQQLEYDICVAPGSHPEDIRLHIEGAQKLFIDEEGILHVLTDNQQEVHMQKPVVYQMIEGEKVSIEGKFVLLAHQNVGFTLGNYDTSKLLVIDPVLIYSTYLGGNGDDFGNGIAVDSSGNAYVTGSTSSTNFPTTPGAFQTSLPGTINAFVTKLNATGSGLIYSTYLGGNDQDRGNSIAVDSSGNAYVTGVTFSNNFPTTPGAFQTSLAGSNDAFVTKLNATGTGLIYSTYLGGNNSDVGNSIALDSSENAYVTGFTNSTTFPTTSGAFQTNFLGSTDAFVTKLNATGTGLVYSTYLGGNNSDEGHSIALDSSGNAYVTGFTGSTTFPTTPGAFQMSLTGPADAFVTKLNATGAGLVYSTYLGGNNNEGGNSIAVDSSGNAYVTGSTNSTNFPTTPGAFQMSFAGAADAFVTKLNATGTGLVYSTYLGGNNDDQGLGIALDSSENAYVTGSTSSTTFPTTPGAFQTSLAGSIDAFVTKLNATGTGLIYSTYLGGNNDDQGLGIALDSSGNAYVTGSTSSITFPTTPGAFQASLAGSTNAFIAKFALGTPTVTGINPSQGPESGGTVVVITGTNFTTATAVNFGEVSASFTINSDSQITAIVPPGTETVDVTVTIVGGISATSAADQFTYQKTSSITLVVSPNPSTFGQKVTLKAIVIPSSATGTVTFFDGNSALATVPLVNGTAIFVTASLAIGPHSLTAVYSGDLFHSSATSPVIVLNVNTISPPTHFRGFQKANRFATQTEYVNILTWKKPSQGKAVAYKIYRDHFHKLIATISSEEELKYHDHHRKEDKTYTYFIVAVDRFGNTSKPASVTIKGR